MMVDRSISDREREVMDGLTALQNAGSYHKKLWGEMGQRGKLTLLSRLHKLSLDHFKYLINRGVVGKCSLLLPRKKDGQLKVGVLPLTLVFREHQEEHLSGFQVMQLCFGKTPVVTVLSSKDEKNPWIGRTTSQKLLGNLGFNICKNLTDAVKAYQQFCNTALAEIRVYGTKSNRQLPLVFSLGRGVYLTMAEAHWKGQSPPELGQDPADLLQELCHGYTGSEVLALLEKRNIDGWARNNMLQMLRQFSQKWF